MRGIATANGKEAARRCLAGAALTAALLGLSAIAQAGTLDFAAPAPYPSAEFLDSGTDPSTVITSRLDGAPGIDLAFGRGSSDAISVVTQQ